MRFHLYNFFDRSVAAGQYDVETNQDWIKQSTALHGTLKIEPELDYMSLQKKAWEFEDKYVHGKKFSAHDFDNETLGHLMHVRKIPHLAVPLRHRGTLTAKFKPEAGAQFAAATRQTTPAASSATKRAPSFATATPAGRP
jgi:hypothetical protein